MNHDKERYKMKLKVITSYKPGCWEKYGKKGIESMAEQFPPEVDIVVYAEEPKPDCKYDKESERQRRLKRTDRCICMGVLILLVFHFK